ncbi:MAG: 23S rRNA (guanosine(2251)-2'-O)-methyltransferase RlmB [Chlamydiales bacterium]|nr:23S rRNA (guanosine(2251)-2'-O)-methyltransferase RlmB [Chlamydiales bacterium]
MGKHALEEVLKHSPKRFIEVHTYKKDDPLTHALKEKGIKVSFSPKHKLASIVSSESHQGFIAKVQEREFLTVKEFLRGCRHKIINKEEFPMSEVQCVRRKDPQSGLLKQNNDEISHRKDLRINNLETTPSKTAPEKSLVLMCDAIQDPQNFGSILRAAECFGVDAVIYSTNRNVALTPVVSKASVGASEIVPLIPVSNLVDTLKKFQDAGYFSVATEISDKAEALDSFVFPEQTLLMIGAEGPGIQPLLSKKSDFHLYIPMKGSIDSLNVSQATAVLLSHWK